MHDGNRAQRNLMKQALMNGRHLAPAEWKGKS